MKNALSDVLLDALPDALSDVLPAQSYVKLILIISYRIYQRGCRSAISTIHMHLTNKNRTGEPILFFLAKLLFFTFAIGMRFSIN